MYADRDQYVGDPAFVKVPVAGLIDPAYVAERAQADRRDRRPAASRRQCPRGALVAGTDKTLEPTGTSHFIVRDADGNVVSMTTTVESIFGTGRMVDGFFLNNQLTDFSFSPIDAQGRPVANAVAPGKRPRSSMVPVDPAHARRPASPARSARRAAMRSSPMSPSRWSPRSTGTCRCRTRSPRRTSSRAGPTSRAR